MKALCFTVDLDRDVNIPVKGRREAGSFDRGNGTQPRFESTVRGTELLVEMLDSLHIDATFFAEARALHSSGAYQYLDGYEVAMHGLDHEDLTGLKTGISLDYGELREIVERSISMIRDCTGMSPKGFRSPYMLANEDLLSFLPEYGITYDSSYYVYADSVVRPYRLDGGLLEIPVVKANDAFGNPITSYLWPVHEGKRPKEDIVSMARELDDGVFVLVTHSWHVCETQGSGKLDDDKVKENISSIRWILETLIDEGFRPMSMAEATRTMS